MRSSWRHRLERGAICELLQALAEDCDDNLLTEVGAMARREGQAGEHEKEKRLNAGLIKICTDAVRSRDAKLCISLRARGSSGLWALQAMGHPLASTGRRARLVKDEKEQNMQKTQQVCVCSPRGAEVAESTWSKERCRSLHDRKLCLCVDTG